LRIDRAAAWVLLVAGLSGARPASAGSLEYRVKAAFLYNFARFVEWPAQAFDGPEAPYAICILGQDPYGEDLDAAAGANTVQGRRIVVRRLSDAKVATDCHILFISTSERRRVPAIIEALGSAPVLTVGEDEAFTRLGGCIRFFLLENKVRLEVNLPAAERARLRVSSKLLNLARVLGKPSSPSKN